MNTVADPVPQLDQVDALIKSIRIPPRPSLLADMQRELASEDPSPEAIGKIVASDVGMSGALLKLANSSIYGGRRKAKSVEQAILFLGINQVAALMTGLLARQAIPTNSAALASFWDISTRRAQAMVFLSRRLRIGEPDVAHTFGLFCDTGVPLLMDRFADYAATYAAASLEAERPFTALEDERHSTSHAAVGCLLARNWGLSGDVGWAILHHHDFAVLEDASTAGAVRSLVALSVLAESAICRYQGHAESLEWNKGGARACAYLGLSDEETAELLDELVEAFHEE
ncbi:HDOD domain-containing protein [Massilia sp. IC2-477]|uniref:HDOD domain-containing protein n=1 Tax=unclassified Massilia TaxID=2609279 RepID=UPI001D108597|nr:MULTISPECIES: HDOD domain-containing protein [unclassified Massilia]MCC2956817.1 HDOD domain-containing protein [Massilia sp. IC2-477]MCC2973235.1 HDOD domain-containing protein [Massilia sp. IC2-476]